MVALIFILVARGHVFGNIHAQYLVDPSSEIWNELLLLLCLLGICCECNTVNNRLRVILVLFLENTECIRVKVSRIGFMFEKGVKIVQNAVLRWLPILNVK